MNTFKQAFLSMIRKKVKTIIIFLVMLILSTFAITGISIYKATSKTALSLRQSVGGSIKLELDESKSANWLYQQGVGGIMVDYIGTPITDNDIQKIMEGIKNYNAVGDGSVFAKDFNFISGISFGMGSDYSRLPSVTNSEYFNYFKRGAFRLVDGRHINADDNHVVLISTALAENNGLKLGDKITVQCCYDTGEYPDVQLMIVGIYEVEQDTDAFLTTSTNKRNRLIVDHHAMQDIMQTKVIEYSNGVDFYVDDPKKIEKIAAKIKDLNLAWDCFKLSIDNTAYETIAHSLTVMQNIVTGLIIGLIAASIIILSLILNMWTKQRTREIGILLSIGISKSRIILQYIIEVLLIAVVSFGFSYFSGNAIAQSTSDLILNKAAETPFSVQMEIPDDGSEYLDITGQYIPYDASDIKAIDSILVEVNPQDLLLVCLVGTVIIILSVMMSSIKIIRMNPKQILSYMS